MTQSMIRLTMNRYTVSRGGSVSVDAGKSYTVMINPAEFTHEHTIEYSKQKALGQLGSDNKFAAVEPDKVRFAIILDGTGAVPPPRRGAAVKDVKEQMQGLLGVVYQYVGTGHEPSRVRLLWGSLIFFGRMTSMSTQYTLFKASGEPLRAKVDLQFVGTMSKSESQLVANRSSPDLTHVVVVRDGDTLPLLCNRIYGDSSYYPEVAQANGLAGFRELLPGQRLVFPPLE